jgi:hypothetical protein
LIEFVKNEVEKIVWPVAGQNNPVNSSLLIGGCKIRPHPAEERE